MSQKTNKIILLVGIIAIIILLIWGMKVYQVRPKKSSISQQELYKKCSNYLRKPILISNTHRKVVIAPSVPKVICKVKKGKVLLVSTDNPNIYPGDTVMEIVDVKKLFTKEYFNKKHYVLTSQQEDALNKGKVNFCVSYGPYVKDHPLILLPAIFQKNKVLNKTAVACQTFNLKYFRPISVGGVIPQGAQGKPFGLSILLPNNKDNISYFSLYQSFIRIK